MIWVSNILQLQYYNQPAGVPCWCESLLFPADLSLQGILTGGQNPYTVVLYTYSADGLTQYENSTANFQIYTAKATNGVDYFNARLEAFTEIMCLHKCFIIRAVVTTSNGEIIFDKYTERYCQTDCCDVPRGISYSQDGLVAPDTPTSPAGLPDVPRGTCGNALISFTSRFDCIDNFTGNFFADPVQVYSGTADWNYTLTTNFAGRLVRRPRDIKREISYNCRLQKTESAPTYLFEGYDMFPAWKMYEIEGQLHANHLYVDDYVNGVREFVFNGGVPFKKVDGANSCTEVFKLETTLNGCIQRQIYGCVENCTQSGIGFIIIPGAYQETGFYSDSGLFIASQLDGEGTSPYVTGLIQWLLSQDGITNAEEIDISGFECEPYTYAIVQVEGTGLIPTSIYFDSPVPANRIYTVVTNSVSELCDYIGAIPCPKPVNGTVVITNLECATPVNGTVVIIEVTTETLDITDYGDWVQNSSSASLYQGQVTFDLETVNTSVIVGIGEDYTFAAEIIATIEPDGRPVNYVTVPVTGDISILIEPSGIIRFSGTVTATGTNEVTITLTNIVYDK